MYDRIVTRKKKGEYINPLFSLQFVRKCFVSKISDRLELFINLETEILLQVSTESRKFNMIEKILLANPDVFYNKINLYVFLWEKTPEIKMYFLKFIYENDLKVSENELSHLLVENIEFHPQIGKFLIQKGVKVHFLRLTGFDSVKLVKAYKNGMDLNITNKHGETLLLASAGNENYSNYTILSSLNIEDKRDRFGTNAKLLIKMKNNLI